MLFRCFNLHFLLIYLYKYIDCYQQGYCVVPLKNLITHISAFAALLSGLLSSISYPFLFYCFSTLYVFFFQLICFLSPAIIHPFLYIVRVTAVCEICIRDCPLLCFWGIYTYQMAGDPVWDWDLPPIFILIMLF